MKKIDREDIYIIARNSNCSADYIDKSLRYNIYNNKDDWEKFLKILFISLGAGFTVLGIVFFFAYNWQDLNKFIKFALIESIITLLIISIFFSKINILTKNIILTVASIIVGVLFAVFGQVYQTGADAYDLFLVWTLAITIWVIIANFPPLFIVYGILLNMTLTLYFSQVANIDVGLISLVVMNLSFSMIFLFLSKIETLKYPNWFLNLLLLNSISWLTISSMAFLFDYNKIIYFMINLFIIIIFYPFITFLAFKEKNIFIIAFVMISLITIVSSFIIKILEENSPFFILIFLIGSTTFLIKSLIKINKGWKDA